MKLLVLRDREGRRYYHVSLFCSRIILSRFGVRWIPRNTLVQSNTLGIGGALLIAFIALIGNATLRG